MKITIGMSEAREIIAMRLRETVGFGNVTATDIIIDPIDIPGQTDYVKAINIVCREFPSMTISGSNQKIPAIKRFRELTGLGLCEAKLAIERPERATEIYERYNRPLNSADY